MRLPAFAPAALAAFLIGGLAPPVHAQQPDGAAVAPFTIDVPDAVLADLQERLRAARFPDELHSADWDYGVSLPYLRELVEYWRDGFDWRTQEARLNRFDQFTTNIDGLDIHFIHQRSPRADALPLLVLNGWPSSIDEYYKVIDALAEPAGGADADAFHVVIPAMPGYGFSDKPREAGFDTYRMADFWVTLMARLGYTRYGVHGSDWGAAVARWVARKDTDRVAGLHLVGCEGVLRSAVPLGRPADMVADGFGYVEIQSTRTQTLGYGLHDSPVGLAAWIVEKYHGWSDHQGNVEQAYTKDELLTNIMLYWVTGSITSASRLYYENRHAPQRPTESITVPTGCAGFVERYDQRTRTGQEARQAAEQRYNIVRWTDMPRGGHFPALEAPDLWLDDVRAFFAGVR